MNAILSGLAMPAMFILFSDIINDLVLEEIDMGEFERGVQDGFIATVNTSIDIRSVITCHNIVNITDLST